MSKVIRALGFAAFTTLFALGQQQTAHYRTVKAEDDSTNTVYLNDLTATPGAVDKSLTKEQLCSPKFHTITARHVTAKMKRQVCVAYAAKGQCPSHQYEIDHLISIELGGSNDTRNLWPQPIDAAGVVGFKTKDIVENRAHAAVCSGTLTLQQAQRDISTDWYSMGLKYGWLNHKAFEK